MEELKSGYIPKHVGLSIKDSLMIAENNRRIEIINGLQDVDLENLSTKQLEKIQDAIDEDFSCPECEKKEEKTNDVLFEFDLFIDELNSRLTDLADDIPRNNKILIECYNLFIDKMWKEWENTNRKMRNDTETSAEYSFKPDKISYCPDMEDEK